MRIRIPARSYFDRTHAWKSSADMGQLIPVCLEEVYPGDTFRDRTEAIVRFEAMIKPAMHEFNVFFHWFFVRDWTIMDDFEDMIYAGADGESTATVPFNAAQVTIAQSSLGDYLGINPGVYDAGYFSMLPFRVYNKIYNDWYRSQNTEPDEVDLDSMVLQTRAWERDFHTGGLPFAQRGPAVLLPLGTEAPIVAATQTFNNTGSVFLTENTSNKDINTFPSSGHTTGSWQAPHTIGNAYADLSTATAASVQDLWLSEQLQKWQMLNGIAGVRYVEGTKAHFGVNTPDARVERAEYLGGGKAPVIVSEVLQTSASSESSAQGNLAGHGISAAITNGFKRTFTEHGFLMCIMSIMPRTLYAQGMDPLWFRQSHLDFMTPEFSRLGYRPVPIKTLYTGAYLKDGEVVDPSTTGAVWTPVADPDKTFNYQAIYNELRFKPSSIHGTFRGKESYWTEARIFDSEPVFNNDFIKCNPSKRIFATPSEPGLKVEVLHHLDCFRELPKEPLPWML